MSINKIALSFALAGILGATAAVAETDGWFIGGQLGLRGMDVKADVSVESSITATDNEGFYYNSLASAGVEGTGSSSAFRLGFLGGYKQFFDPKFGARYYVGADFLDNTQNYNINADALYNFASKGAFEFGAFAGLWVGYTRYDMGIDTLSGVDLGINIGLKAQIAQRHGVELFGHFGFLEQTMDYPTPSYYRALDGGSMQADSDIKIKLKQPYHIGVRYTFSF